MRLSSTRILACSMIAAGFAPAGCADDDATAPPGGATASATISPSSGTGTVADCVTGSWRTTALPPDTETGTVDADVTGGAGISVRIQPSGRTVIDFSDMQPVTFSAHVGTADVRGRFTYAGTATGTMTTTPGGTADPGATSSMPADMIGSWQPVGDLDWDNTTFTLDLTDPVEARPFDNVPLDRYTGSNADETGDVVDIDPFFDAGRYACQGDTLTVTPDDDGDLPMVLQRS